MGCNRGFIFGRFRRNQCNNRVVFPCRQRIFQFRRNYNCANSSKISNSTTIDNFSSIKNISTQNLEPASARAARELNAICSVLNSLENYHGTIRGQDARSGKRGSPEAKWTTLKRESEKLNTELSNLYTEEQQLDRIDSFKKKLLSNINSIAGLNHKSTNEIRARIDFARSDLLRENLSNYQYDEKQSLTERLAQFEEISQEATRALPQISDPENRKKWANRIRSTVDKVNSLLSSNISHQSIVELEQILAKELGDEPGNNGIISLAKWRNDHGAINIARGDGNRFFVEVPNKDFIQNSNVYICSPECSASLITGGPTNDGRFYAGTHRTGTSITVKARRNSDGAYVSTHYWLPCDLLPKDISINKDSVSSISITPESDTSLVPEYEVVNPKPETPQRPVVESELEPQEDTATQHPNPETKKVQVLDPFESKNEDRRPPTRIKPGDNLFPSGSNKVDEPSLHPSDSIPEPKLNPSGDTSIPEPRLKPSTETSPTETSPTETDSIDPKLHPSNSIPEPTLHPSNAIPEPRLRPSDTSSWSPEDKEQLGANLELMFARLGEGARSRRQEEKQRRDQAWKQYLEMLAELENDSSTDQYASNRRAIA